MNALSEFKGTRAPAGDIEAMFESELVPWMRQEADIFLSCHRQDDPSCAYLEAMGCGLPVLGYELPDAAQRAALGIQSPERDGMYRLMPGPGVGHIKGLGMKITAFKLCQHKHRFYRIQLFTQLLPEIQWYKTGNIGTKAVKAHLFYPVFHGIGNVLTQAWLVVI